MNKPECRMEDKTLMVSLSGKIDSSVSPEVEETIHEAIAANQPESLVLDCDQLEYITSAGLRVILRLKKEIDATRLINVHREVYDIFDITGFTSLLDIQKAIRVVSVAGCEVVGEGVNGRVYRIDQETIVKVYMNPDALSEIHHERKLTRAAFIAGVPTAIPYDVVRIEGGGYGAVYELLVAKNLARVVATGEKTLDEAARISINLLKQIHSKKIETAKVPNIKAAILKRNECLKDYLSAEQYDKLHALISDVPENDHLLHGDFHLKNILLQGDEALVIDMDTLSYGHPVFELALMYTAYCGFGVLNHSIIEDFLGISYDTAHDFWRKSLELYLGTNDETRIRDVETKAMIIGYTRVMRRSIRHIGPDTSEGKALINHCRQVFDEYLPKTVTLSF